MKDGVFFRWVLERKTIRCSMDNIEKIETKDFR